MKENEAISFEQMCKGNNEWEESEVKFSRPPLINDYEARIPGSEGLEQSGFSSKKSHK